MKIRWFEMVSEEELRRRSGQPTIIKKLRVNRWKRYDHVLIMSDQKNPQASIAMETSLPGKSGEAEGHLGEDHSKRYDVEGTGSRRCRGASCGPRRVEEVRCSPLGHLGPKRVK